MLPSVQHSRAATRPRRRRFRGYCPSATRRSARTSLTTDDEILSMGEHGEYTTSLCSPSHKRQSQMPDRVHCTVEMPPPKALKDSLADAAPSSEDDFATMAVDPQPSDVPSFGVRRRKRKGSKRRNGRGGGYVTTLDLPPNSSVSSLSDEDERREQAEPYGCRKDRLDRADLTKREGPDPSLGARPPDEGSLGSVTSSSGESDGAVSSSSLLKEGCHDAAFATFRMTFLIVHVAIMLADGLQGTHLYVLYEGYGYSVASLYCLGFVTGAITSPFTGPLVDKIGRRNSAILYCALEMAINMLEQYPNLIGLVAARMVGGVTTNLLFSVFETWLVTEHRSRGFPEEKLETILRDMVIVSNLAAIASGYLAHVLAELFGPVGPFEGAVSCTAVALVLVAMCWTENYGSEASGVRSVKSYMTGAVKTIVADSNISRIGIIQGFTEGALQTFVFLWSPALRHFANGAPAGVLGLDDVGQPAYGLIFGAFMACGVLGGLAEPLARKVITILVSPPEGEEIPEKKDTVELEGEGEIKPAAVEFLTVVIYTLCAALLLVPYLLPADSPYAFSVALVTFLIYEFMVGLYMPCEGVIRSIYMPTSSMCSLLTMLRVIVNVAVALGVISTNYVCFTTAFAAVSMLMLISALLQLTMISKSEWSSFVERVRALSWKVMFTPKKSSPSPANGVVEASKLRETGPSHMHSWSSSSLPPLIDTTHNSSNSSWAGESSGEESD